jgi:hypothetical protein
VNARKIVLTGGAVALLLVAGSVALLSWLDRPSRSGGGRPDTTPSGETPGAAASGAGPADPALPALPGQPGLPAESAPLITEPTIGARPSAAAVVPWEMVPAASKPAELGPALAVPVNTALRAARATIESCFEEDRRLRAGRPAPTVDPDNVPTGPAVLVLQLESRGGALDVVSATVESLGTSTRELAECACQVLRGWPIDAPAATAGRRYRLKYSLL